MKLLVFLAGIFLVTQTQASSLNCEIAGVAGKFSIGHHRMPTGSATLIANGRFTTVKYESTENVGGCYEYYEKKYTHPNFVLTLHQRFGSEGTRCAGIGNPFKLLGKYSARAQAPKDVTCTLATAFY